MSHGLKVEIIEHNEVARNLGKGSLSDDCKTILFAAEQLQFSDDQVINFECFESCSKYVFQFLLPFEYGNLMGVSKSCRWRYGEESFKG